MSKVQTTLKQIIDILLQEGFKYQVSRKDLEKAIMSVRGIDDRTFQRWIKALTYFEYLIPKGNEVYELNPVQVPEILNTLKNMPQTKLG